MKGSFESCKNFKCGKFLNVATSVEISDSKAESATVGLESVDTFYYLGDMVSAGGGVEEAVRCWVKCAWGKFNEHMPMPILTMRGTSLRQREDLRSLCAECDDVWQ